MIVFHLFVVGIMSSIVTTLILRVQLKNRFASLNYWMEKSVEFANHLPHHERFYVMNCEEDIRVHVTYPLDKLYSLFKMGMGEKQAIELTISFAKKSGLAQLLNRIIVHYLTTVRDNVDYAKYYQIVYGETLNPVRRQLIQGILLPETVRRISEWSQQHTSATL